MALATLAGGCFWCVEAVFDRLIGVDRVVSGYLGGTLAHPSYEQVCSGVTGHAEAIQVEFDAAVISYRELLEIFFAFHDPTTKNRQGGDVGTQYRSAIFTHDDTQAATERAVIGELEAARVFANPIVTDVVPATTFNPAEAYHQDYYERNPNKGYCAAVIAPKVSKLRQKYAERMK